jgi:hypothetical protein
VTDVAFPSVRGEQVATASVLCRGHFRSCPPKRAAKTNWWVTHTYFPIFVSSFAPLGLWGMRWAGGPIAHAMGYVLTPATRPDGRTFSHDRKCKQVATAPILCRGLFRSCPAQSQGKNPRRNTAFVLKSARVARSTSSHHRPHFLRDGESSPRQGRRDTRKSPRHNSGAVATRSAPGDRWGE